MLIWEETKRKQNEDSRQSTQNGKPVTKMRTFAEANGNKIQGKKKKKNKKKKDESNDSEEELDD